MQFMVSTVDGCRSSGVVARPVRVYRHRSRSTATCGTRSNCVNREPPQVSRTRRGQFSFGQLRLLLPTPPRQFPARFSIGISRLTWMQIRLHARPGKGVVP